MHYLLSPIPLDVQLDIFSYLSHDDLDNICSLLSPDGKYVFWQEIIKRNHKVTIRDATSEDSKFLDRLPYNFFKDNEECIKDFNAKFNSLLRKIEEEAEGEYKCWTPTIFDGYLYRAKTPEGAIYTLMSNSNYYTSVSELYTRLDYPVVQRHHLTERMYTRPDEIASSLQERLMDGLLPPYTKRSKVVRKDEVIFKEAILVIQSRMRPILEDRILSFV